MDIKAAQRLSRFPKYLFDTLDELKASVVAKGMDVIDLGVGDPDAGTPSQIVDELKRAVENSDNHHYPNYKGLPVFRNAIADWYKKSFGVELDPETEVLSLIGSKSGMAHLPLAVVNPGETILLPDPCYAGYKPGILISDAEIFEMPLLEQNAFLPDLSEIPEDVAKKTKLMILNYPNNPTGAVATSEFFEEVVEFASKYEIIVAHDAPYSAICFDKYRHPSFLETPGAKVLGVEFHSMSKLFNMTGWRIAFVVGNADIVAALGKLKSNFDMGIFQPIQYAAVKALSTMEEYIEEMTEVYEKRRNLVVNGLKSIGWKVPSAPATFFVWMPVPEEGKLSMDFASEVLEKSGVLLTPGIGFGKYGEGYLRLALTHPEDILSEAIERLKKTGFIYGDNFKTM